MAKCFHVNAETINREVADLGEKHNSHVLVLVIPDGDSGVMPCFSTTFQNDIQGLQYVVEMLNNAITTLKQQVVLQ